MIQEWPSDQSRVRAWRFSVCFTCPQVALHLHGFRIWGCVTTNSITSARQHDSPVRSLLQPIMRELCVARKVVESRAEDVAADARDGSQIAWMPSGRDDFGFVHPSQGKLYRASKGYW